MDLERAIETTALRFVRPDHPAGRSAAGLVSDAARGGALWAGVSIAGAASEKTRAAAAEGLAAWAAATATAFAIKGLTGRARPRLTGFGASPVSSSMPSSHTAGAVAYATAATLRTPLVGPAVVPLAGAVAWSRTATGRHFPTDVLAGAAVGVLAGAVTHLVARRLRRDAEPV